VVPGQYYEAQVTLVIVVHMHYTGAVLVGEQRAPYFTKNTLSDILIYSKVRRYKVDADSYCRFERNLTNHNDMICNYAIAQSTQSITSRNQKSEPGCVSVHRQLNNCGPFFNHETTIPKVHVLRQRPHNSFLVKVESKIYQ